MVCCFSVKKSRKLLRISEAVMVRGGRLDKVAFLVNLESAIEVQFFTAPHFAEATRGKKPQRSQNPVSSSDLPG